jgi:hypothetical protein
MVYEIKTLESPVAGEQNFKTQLQQLPRYIVFNLAHKFLAAVENNPTSDDSIRPIKMANF